MSAPESLRDEVAAVLWEAIDGKGIRGRLYREDCDYLADALLASPALARVIREAKADAWDEATDYDVARAVVRHCEDRGGYVGNPYREEQP